MRRGDGPLRCGREVTGDGRGVAVPCSGRSTDIMRRGDLNGDPGLAAPRPARPSEHGQRRDHRVALQRADVLRRLCSPATSRSAAVVPGAVGPGDRASSTSPFASVNTTVLVLSSVTCQLGVFAAERGQVGPQSGKHFQVGKWGLREWFVLTYVMGAFFIGGQVNEYAELDPRGHHDPVLAVRVDLLPHHRLPRPPRDRRPDRLPVRPRAHVHGPHFTHEQAVTAIVVSVLLALRRRRLDRPVRDHLPAEVTQSAPEKEESFVKFLSTRRRHPLAGLLVVLLGLRRRRAASTPRSAGGRGQATRRTRRWSPQGRELFVRRLRQLPRPERRGHRHQARHELRPRPRRCRRGGGRLPGRHRPDAAGQRRARRPPEAADLHRRGDRASSRRTSQPRPRPGDPRQRRVPTPATDDSQIARGGQFFRTNCTACHNFAGRGGALPTGEYAPPLLGTSPRHIYRGDAHRPAADAGLHRRGAHARQKRDIIAYITTLKTAAELRRLQPGPPGPRDGGSVGLARSGSGARPGRGLDRQPRRAHRKEEAVVNERPAGQRAPADRGRPPGTDERGDSPAPAGPRRADPDPGIPEHEPRPTDVDPALERAGGAPGRDVVRPGGRARGPLLRRVLRLLARARHRRRHDRSLRGVQPRLWALTLGLALLLSASVPSSGPRS